MKKRRTGVLFCIICLLTLASWCAYKNLTVASDGTEGLARQGQNRALPVVGSYENFKQLMAESLSVIQPLQGFRSGREAAYDATAVTGTTINIKADSNDQNYGSLTYSGTNIQVQGVDEADTVKTDGKYIYKISNNQLTIVKAYPADEMEIVSTLKYDDENYPIEMYVDDQYLTVILGQNSYWYSPVAEDNDSRDIQKWPNTAIENSVKVLIYDLADRSKLKLVREVELEGSYLSSRKIGDIIYLVNNKYIPVEQIDDRPEALFTPRYRDSLTGKTSQRIGFENIYYFPGCLQSNYLIVASIDLANLDDKTVEINTYLGGGQNIYCSPENLYIAVPQYKYAEKSRSQADDTAADASPDTSVSVNINKSMIWLLPTETNTHIYKFNLKNGSVNYQGTVTVPGEILNQFSMDEHNGYFRIATTVQKYSETGELSKTNNLYIFDNAMNQTGKIENIAPGEQIYSVRFMGDRGYMVTFQTVDPLFALDLKDPYHPAILGELKIPGYSNYLHPYDENHIIGFGKETIEVEEDHWSGEGTVKNAYYLGMKVALFDVSDINNPKEKFKIEIGDRGTESELFWNHKALLFDREKGLLAFPVTVCQIDQTAVDKNDYLVQKDPRLAYGQPVFQGALVYNLSPEKGFTLKGKITHHPAENLSTLQKTGRYDYNLDISRILYIENTLYTISNGYLKANDLNTLLDKNGIALLK